MRWASCIAVLAVLVSSPSAAVCQEPEATGTQKTAVGVTVTVKADAWTGVPAELTEVIPLLVTIENNSRVPIRLRYAEFTLAGNGKRTPALPPLEITGTETEPVGTAGLLDGPYPFPLTGFYIAPRRVIAFRSMVSFECTDTTTRPCGMRARETDWPVGFRADRPRPRRPWRCQCSRRELRRQPWVTSPRHQP